MSDTFRIVEFNSDLAGKFKDINKEWITKMFRLEAKDEKVLNFPQREIIDGGGHILFVELPRLGIVGTCALLKTGEDQYELTKMGVLETARGKNAGKHLLKAAIAKAQSVGAKRLYLLTNTKCATAIHLYEAHGFKHDKEIMKLFGSEYDRCDVAMLFDQSQKK